jgi:hypothetical protein
MRFTAAKIREQGVTFAVVVVRSHVVDDRSRANQLIHSLEPHFGWVPIVLMAEDYSGRARYYGRRDIAKFLTSVPVNAIPWYEYTLS